MTDPQTAAPEAQVAETVMVPAKGDGAVKALAKLYGDIKAAKASGLTGVALITAEVMAAVQDLAGVMGDIGAVEGEAKADPLGEAEVLVLAIFKILRGQ